MKTYGLFFLLFPIFFYVKVDAQNLSAHFTSFSQYYRCGNINITGKQLTVEALVKLDGTGPYFTGQSANDIVSKHNGANDANYILRPDHCEITTTNGHFLTSTPLSSYSRDSFYHVAMTYNGSFLRFYVNGCLNREVVATGDLITNNHTTTIGQLASNPTALSIEQLYGFADEIRIWSVVRTQTEISDNMKQLSNPTLQTGLLAYYNFENNSNNIQGNAAYHAIPFGNPAIEQQNEFVRVKPLNATYKIQQVTCNANGAITIIANSGKSPYQYSINGGVYQSSSAFSNLNAGVYTVSVKSDGAGCVKDTTITLTSNCNQSTSCNNWLKLPSQPSYFRIGDLDIPGNKLTIEATYNRTSPWNGVDLFQGDLVSKHEDFKDANYLLRPSSAEIVTTNGYFKTPVICPPELNKTYHAALVYDGNSLKFYRNGSLMSQVAASGNLIQNDWLTQVGLYFNGVTQQNFVGYINEVRIWNIARSQSEIQTYMNQSLPTPQTTNGLLAYYTFDNLINKQGNASWNGILGGTASINQVNTNCAFVADSCNILQVNVKPGFSAPDTVCVNAPVNISNTTIGASSYYWNFCVADINSTPSGFNLGNVGNLFSSPVFIDYAFYNNNYYGFLVNYNPGRLIRLDFGNSLLNTPTSIDLGNFGSIIPGIGAEGIQVIFNEGNWYAIIVGGNTADGFTPRILKIDFGPSLTNLTPTATNWNNLGNMLQPIDLHLFKEGANWFGFTTNAENNTITRFNFSNSFNNTPTAINLGNVGNLAYPTGIHAINDNGFWRVFIVNGGNKTRSGGTYSLSRLDFGSSLLNTPTGVNLGNPGNVLQHPRDLTIMKMCDQIIGFAVNGHLNNSDIVKFDFNNNLSAPPNVTSLGVIANSSFPHSISRLFRVNNDVYSFITNVSNNTLTRLKFTGCASSSIPNSTAQNPPSIVYSTPGTYNINLTIDDGLPTQSAICKQVVVLPSPIHSPTKNLDLCFGGTIKIGSGVRPASYLWNTGAFSDSIIVSAPGTFWVEANRYGCSVRDSFIVSLNSGSAVQVFNSDTTIFAGDVVPLNSYSANSTYIWSPANNLSCSNCSHPIASPKATTKYFLSASNSCGVIKDSVLINVLTRPNMQCSGLQLAMGSNVNERAYDVVASLNNEFITVGIKSTSGNDDILVTKLDLNGSVIWSKTFGGSGSESVRKIYPTSDGGVLIAGQTKSFGNPNGDMLCVKVSNAGSIVWTRKFGVGSPSGDLAMDIIETTDGGFAISGIFNVNGLVADAVVIKIDNGANIIWARKFDRGNGEDGVGIIQKGDTLLVATDLQNVSGNYSMAITKLKLIDGSVIMSKQLIPGTRGIFNPYLHRNPAQSGYIISGHTIDGSSYSNMKHTILILNDNLDIISTKLISITPVTNDFFTSIQPLSDGSFIGCASPQFSSDGFVYRIDASNNITYVKKFNGTADRRLYRLTTTGEDVIAVGGTIVNGQEDFFITNFKKNGTGTGCDIQDASITIQQPVYNSSVFTWPSVSSVTFSNPIISLSANDIILTKINLCPKPVIDFNFQQSLCSPKTVQFTSNLSGAQSYQWSFGDGQTNSNSQTPSVTFANYGTYTIKLNLQYPEGCKDSLVKSINIENLQDNNLIQNYDTTICFGDSILLKTSNTALNFCWRSSVGPVPVSLTSFVKPDTTTTYTLSSQMTGNNLIVNGDFNSGNTNFTSQYLNNNASGFAAGVYNVGSNITAWHPGMTPCQDHTTGNGNMMMVNGADQPNVIVWSQNVTVLPNTNYTFYTWLQTITTINPAQLQFSINGKLLGNIFSAKTQSCMWDRFNATWNSGNNTSATISIVNMNTQFSGNDFALDDIFFGPVVTRTDSITVVVSGLCDSINITGPDKICSASDTLTYSIFKSANCDKQYTIQVDNSFASIVSQTSTTTKILFKKSGITSLKVAYSNDCKIVVDSLPVSINLAPSSINLGPDIVNCRDTSFILNAGIGFMSYLWQDGSTGSGFFVSKPGEYHVVAQSTCGLIVKDTIKLVKSLLGLFYASPAKAVACVGDSVRFNASGGSIYSWSPSLKFNLPNASSSLAIIDFSQNYSVKISDPVCLRDTLIVIPVTASSGPQIILTKSNDVTCSNDSAVLIAKGAVSYTWSPNLFVTYNNNGRLTVKPPKDITYTVQSKDAFGCTKLDSITVKFFKEGDQKLFIPTGFTPNGDGLNDVFRPVFIGPTTRYNFTIYNRWGQLIFRSGKPGEGWDGKFRSVQQPNDVYVFYLNAEGGCNGKFEKKGTFVLIK